ncbi:unnamed protein product [Natator depressus]
MRPRSCQPRANQGRGSRGAEAAREGDPRPQDQKQTLFPGLLLSAGLPHAGLMVTVTCNDHPRLVLDENRCLVFGTLCGVRLFWGGGTSLCRGSPRLGFLHLALEQTLLFQSESPPIHPLGSGSCLNPIVRVRAGLGFGPCPPQGPLFPPAQSK